MTAFLLKIDEIIGMVLNAPLYEIIALVLLIVWIFGAAILMWIVVDIITDKVYESIKGFLMKKINREEPDGQS